MPAKELIEVLQNKINKLEKEVYLLRKEKENELWNDNELVSMLQIRDKYAEEIITYGGTTRVRKL